MLKDEKVSAATFVEMKAMINDLKKKQSTIREIKRALLRKYPRITKEEWAKTIPSIFAKTRKPITNLKIVKK